MVRNFETLRGGAVRASDGEVGAIRETYFDDAHWTVRYLIVTVGAWPEGRDVLMSPKEAGPTDAQSASMGVRLTMEQVQKAPSIQTDQPIFRQYEGRLAEHYRWDPYWLMPSAASGMFTASLPSPAHAAMGAAEAPAVCNVKAREMTDGMTECIPWGAPCERFIESGAMSERSITRPPFEATHRSKAQWPGYLRVLPTRRRCWAKCYGPCSLLHQVLLTTS